MSVELRIMLIISSVFCLSFVIRKVRKTQMNIDDSLFWIIFSLLIVLMALFPQVIIDGTEKIGVGSPVNFVYLVIIFVLIAKEFSQSVKLSQMENKIKMLTQIIALNSNDEERKQ